MTRQRWFGQPSVPPPKFDGISQDLPSTGFDPFKKSNDNSFNSALKSEFVEPFTSAEKTVVSAEKSVQKEVVSDVDKVKNELTTIKDGIVTGFRDIKDEFSYVGSEVKIGFDKTEEGVIWGFNNIVKPLALDSIDLLESTVNGLKWLVMNRNVVLLAVGSYGAFRFMNEAKMALK